MHPEFSLAPDVVYLNHAGIGPWPRRTVEAIKRFAEENAAYGAIHSAPWLGKETLLRNQAKTLLNAPSHEQIALLKSTSEALSVVAYGLDWRQGDKVVCPLQEFPSNRIVWQSLKDRFGVDTQLVDLNESSDPEATLIAAIDTRTRLLSVSAVQFQTGMRLDLNRLGEACRKAGVAFCIDAIQALGAVPFDVQACQADFVMADGRKWMLAPEGLALFYCNETWLARLKLNQFGWHMVNHASDYDRLDWEPAHDARRFESGCANNLGIQALSASLSLLQEVGIGQVYRQIQEKIEFLTPALLRLDMHIVTPERASRRAGIISFRPAKASAEALFKSLSQSGIYCALRGGNVRFSPHFYTSEESLDRAIRAVEQFHR